jgi:hypothetical protein
MARGVLRRSRVAGVLLGTAAWLSAGWLHAQATVKWQLSEGCPTEQELTDKTEQLLGHPLGKTDQPAAISAEVAKQADERWRVDLSMTRGDEETHRRIEGESCQAVADAAAVAIALALKPPEQGSAAEPAPSEQAPAEPSERPPPPVRTPPSRRAVRPRAGKGPARPVTTHLRLAGLADAFTFPGVAFGGSLALAVVVRKRWRVELVGLLAPGQTFDAAAPAKITFGLSGGGVRGCYEPIQASVTLAACIGFEAASVTATGSGAGVAGESQSVAWLGPNAGLLLLWPVLGPVSLAVLAESAAPLVRRRFSILGLSDEVHRWPVATFRGGIGVEVILP